MRQHIYLSHLWLYYALITDSIGVLVFGEFVIALQLEGMLGA